MALGGADREWQAFVEQAVSEWNDVRRWTGIPDELSTATSPSANDQRWRAHSQP